MYAVLNKNLLLSHEWKEKKKKQKMSRKIKEMRKDREERRIFVENILCRQEKEMMLNLQATLYLIYNYFWSSQTCFDFMAHVPFCVYLGCC